MSSRTSAELRGAATTQSHTVRIVVGTAAGVIELGADGAERQLQRGADITSVHPDGEELWLLVGHRDLHRIDGRGHHRVARLPAGSRGTCVVTHAGTAWIGADPAGLWRLDDDVLVQVESFRDGPTSEEWHTPWAGPASVLSMASSGDDLLVSVHVGGILRSSDRGRSWQATIDLHDDVHQVVVDGDGTLWAATGMRGLAESRDRGVSWLSHTKGLHASYALAVAATADGVLVGVSSGHAGRDGAIYRFDGTRFTPAEGLPERMNGAVGPRQLASLDDVAAVALPGGDVYRSDDRGRSWRRIAERIARVSDVTLSKRPSTT